MLQTLIQLGSSTYPELVDVKVFDLVKDFSSLQPASITMKKDIILFDIPVSHVSGFVCDANSYTIETDTGMSYCKTMKTQKIESTDLFLKYPPAVKEYDRISIIRQRIEDDSFLIKKEANFAHVYYIKERQDAIVEYYGRQWTTRCEIKWVYPYYSLTEPDHIVFRCRPVYSISISTNGTPDENLVLGFMDVAMPRLLRGLYQSR